MEYRYGMRLRGFSPGCQPMKGFLRREDDKHGKYYDIIVYSRELTAQELTDYELDDIRDIDFGEEPERYYAIIYADGSREFASMDRFDWAVDMLLEDDDEDAYIGLIQYGLCVQRWYRKDVTEN